MDATAGDRQKAPAPPSDVGPPQTSVPEARRAPLPGVVAGGSGGAAVESGGEDDEQVEMFYALLANIRALRGMYRAGDGVSTDSGGEDGRSRKRARGAEPPWRPAFRMEDFEEAVVDAGCAKKERRGAVRQPAAAGKEAGDDEEDEEGQVVEGQDRVSTSHRAGVLTS